MTSRSLTVAFTVFLLLSGSLLAWVWYSSASAFQRGYQAGYVKGNQDGQRHALYARPVSDELELVCAGLWFAEQHRVYEERLTTLTKEQQWK